MKTSVQAAPNRLINEKSPYLLRHARNPVDWYPWGEEAFNRAKLEDKPVFLSIGYLSCHWCHVMEQESFSDEEVARLLNEGFISIKVDREERPDVDAAYMEVCHLLTDSGGWPLTIIMTPDRKPFYADTYMPKTSMFGRTGLLEFLPRVRELWERQRSDITATGEHVLGRLRRMSAAAQRETLQPGIIDAAFAELSERYDGSFGGFGEAPKFPSPHLLLFLLRYGKRAKDRHPWEMAKKTLSAMREGGIYDQLGYGIHRYATDRKWRVPHFEKMLCDQALLALACCEACAATDDDYYRIVAQEVLDFSAHDLRGAEGGFCSAIDADSEGVEGKFYLWTEKEVRAALDKDEAEFALRLFNVKPEGNFPDEATGRLTGENILHLSASFSTLAPEFGCSEYELVSRTAQVRVKLLAARNRRVRPATDDKVLTDWNGLMIAAYAAAARLACDDNYTVIAENAAALVAGKNLSANGRLFHLYRDGSWSVPGFLDDYAFLVWGMLELYETTFKPEHLRCAVELMDYQLAHFLDEKNGGFYFTADNGEEVLVRRKEYYDTAYPSGNGVSLQNLLRLARLTGRADYEREAARLAESASGSVMRAPSACVQLLQGLAFAWGPSREVVISGAPGVKDTRAMIEAVREVYAPDQVVLFHPEGDEAAGIEALAPFTKDLVPTEGKATAYVCSNGKCALPLTEPGKVIETLSQ